MDRFHSALDFVVRNGREREEVSRSFRWIVSMPWRAALRYARWQSWQQPLRLLARPLDDEPILRDVASRCLKVRVSAKLDGEVGVHQGVLPLAQIEEFNGKVVL